MERVDESVEAAHHFTMLDIYMGTSELSEVIISYCQGLEHLGKSVS